MTPLGSAAAALVACAAFGAALDGQGTRDAAPLPRAALGSVSGTVVTDESPARPLRRATVTLGGQWPSPARTTVTSDTGQFTFAGVAPGRYPLTADRNGYVAGAHGARRPGGAGTAIVVAAGEAVADITITVTRGGVITGVIFDSEGQPTSCASVATYRWGLSAAGERTLSPVAVRIGGQLTDSRGVYRIFGLPPGDYLVAAVWCEPRQSGDIRVVSEAEIQRVRQLLRSPAAPSATAGAADTARSGGAIAYAPAFFPGVPRVTDATVVTLAAGEERTGIDFQIRRLPAAAVSGAIVGVDGQPAPGVTVALAALDQPQLSVLNFLAVNLSATSNRDGRFSIAGVPPGRYVASARVGPSAVPGRQAASATTGWLFAQSSVDVAGTDTTVSLALQPVSTISGEVVVDRRGDTPAPDLARLHVPLTPLASTRLVARAVPGGAVEADGRFAIPGVPPGSYRLGSIAGVTQTSAWVLKSATLGGRDVLDAPFEIGADDAGRLVIALTDRPTELTGVMQDAAGHPAPDYHLVVFSVERTHWRPLSRRIQHVRPGVDGRFAVRNLPAGEYFLGAVTDVEANQWFDPAFLEPLAAASIRLTLAEDERKIQDIRVR